MAKNEKCLPAFVYYSLLTRESIRARDKQILFFYCHANKMKLRQARLFKGVQKRNMIMLKWTKHSRVHSRGKDGIHYTWANSSPFKCLALILILVLISNVTISVTNLDNIVLSGFEPIGVS